MEAAQILHDQQACHLLLQWNISALVFSALRPFSEVQHLSCLSLEIRCSSVFLECWVHKQKKKENTIEVHKSIDIGEIVDVASVCTCAFVFVESKTFFFSSPCHQHTKLVFRLPHASQEEGGVKFYDTAIRSVSLEVFWLLDKCQRSKFGEKDAHMLSACWTGSAQPLLPLLPVCPAALGAEVTIGTFTNTKNIDTHLWCWCFLLVLSGTI